MFGLVVILLTGATGVRAQEATLVGPCHHAPALDLTTLVSAPDTAPRLLSEPPRTPRFALRDGYRGTVQLAVVIDTAGHPEAGGAVVLAASDAQLRDWACAYASQLRFTPAKVGDRAVRTQAVVPFTFRAVMVRRAR
ncbi:MAG: energy transducer TonB [Gemmatimonadaceae bacterium]|nr:energy transducer TonB [Gemmatimonadaceae bacterium]